MNSLYFRFFMAALMIISSSLMSSQYDTPSKTRPAARFPVGGIIEALPCGIEGLKIGSNVDDLDDLAGVKPWNLGRDLDFDILSGTPCSIFDMPSPSFIGCSAAASMNTSGAGMSSSCNSSFGSASTSGCSAASTSGCSAASSGFTDGSSILASPIGCSVVALMNTSGAGMSSSCNSSFGSASTSGCSAASTSGCLAASNSFSGGSSVSSSTRGSSSAASFSAASLKKNKNRQRNNDAHLAYIKGLKTPSTPEVTRAAQRLTQMHDTERRTIKVGAATIAGFIHEKASAGSSDPVLKNQNLSKAIRDPKSELGKAIAIISQEEDCLSDLKRKISAVDVDHATGKHIKRDSTGVVTDVLGSHNLSLYDFGSEIDDARLINCFVDMLGVIGFCVGSQVPKTVLPSFTDEKAVEVLATGTTIAQGIGSLKITLTQTSDDKVFASYSDKKATAFQKTLYPVYSVNADLYDRSGNVTVGYFGKIKSDLSGADCVYPVMIPRDRLLAFMDAGVRLRSEKAGMTIVDITTSMNDYLAVRLGCMGKSKMPGNVYAYKMD